MDSELQKYLEQMEVRLGTSFRTELQEMRTELRMEIQHAKDETIASAREMQTEVIRYIGNTAEPFNVRMRHLEANTGNQETAERLRLAAIEERLLRIEMRVLGGK
jgi:ribosomal protein S24E